MLKRLALLWFMLPASAGAWTHGYTPGPVLCSLITGQCAEAWSVTHRIVTGYSGPLFRLALASDNTGNTYLDVGQDPNTGKADMTTWATFCNNVQSNCKISKIYAQVNGHANDLAPSIYKGIYGPDCTAGGLTCASPFQIEGATGLPVLTTTQPQEYTVVGEVPTTGITIGRASRSVMAVTQDHAVAVCCGYFGVYHKYNTGNVTGTDFGLTQSYGIQTNRANCSTSSNYCFGPDLEQNTNTFLASPADYCVHAGHPANLVAIMTYDSPSDTIAGSINGTQMFSGNPVAAGLPMTIDGYLHLGGGGDLSQPAPAILRDMMLTNTAVSLADQATLRAAVAVFYPGLTFPSIVAGTTC